MCVLILVQSTQLDGLKKIPFQRFAPCNPDNYIITNHSLLKRKSSYTNGNNIRKVNSDLVLAKPPTPNDVARELMPKTKIAKLVSEASDSTKSLLKAFEAGDFKIESPLSKKVEEEEEASTVVSGWDDMLEEEKAVVSDEARSASSCEVPCTKDQQEIEHVLRENSYFLYNLQVAQYQRLSGIISKSENSYATKLARNITDLGIVIPTGAVIKQNEVDKALKESDLVNDLIPTEDGDEPLNENKCEPNEVDTKA